MSAAGRPPVAYTGPPSYPRKYEFFFFQAEDGIRDIGVTGVQTCALPIFCVGQDLGQHVEALRGDAATSLSVVEEEYNPLVRALAALRVPVVVAVNGAAAGAEIGRAACRERGEIPVVGGSFKKKKRQLPRR